MNSVGLTLKLVTNIKKSENKKQNIINQTQLLKKTFSKIFFTYINYSILYDLIRKKKHSH